MTQKRDLSDSIGTYTGKRVWPLEIKKENIDIRDIARSLSMQCRWNGHLKEFYSVAQHCVLVSDIVNEFHLEALLHDAAEVYVGDIPHPVKTQLQNWESVENEILYKVGEKYKASLVPLPKEVEEVDRRLAADEAMSLRNHHPPAWLNYEEKSLDIDITPWPPDVAERQFLDYYERYSNDYDARRAS